jgi:hypothetical protein
MSRPMTMVMLAICAVLALAGCGGEPSTSSTATASAAVSADPSAAGDGLPDGWSRVVVADHDFSVGLPPEWISASLDDVGDEDLFADLIGDNPDAAALLEQTRQAIESGQINLFAFDPGERTQQANFAANLNVIDIGDPGNDSAESVRQQMVEQLPQQIPGASVRSSTTVVLPSGEAAVVELEWTLNEGEEAVEVTLTQYAIIAGDRGFILSLTAPRQFAADYQTIWDDVAASFRVE